MVDRNWGIRVKAWTHGRSLRNQLIDDYRREYGIDVPPPPALIVDELLTDFLGVELRYLPLDEGIYAQTEYENNVVVVTVNELTSKIPGLKDAIGVQNVGKFHEMVHVDRDLNQLRSGDQGILPGFESRKQIKCYRDTGTVRSAKGVEWMREFWAEEAGRAAAVSYSALSRSEAFQALSKASFGVKMLSNAEVWQLVGQSAADIGVNISALVTQLRLEGWIAVEEVAGRRVIHL